MDLSTTNAPRTVSEVMGHAIPTQMFYRIVLMLLIAAAIVVIVDQSVSTTEVRAMDSVVVAGETRSSSAMDVPLTQPGSKTVMVNSVYVMMTGPLIPMLTIAYGMEPTVSATAAHARDQTRGIARNARTTAIGMSLAGVNATATGTVRTTAATIQERASHDATTAVTSGSDSAMNATTSAPSPLVAPLTAIATLHGAVMIVPFGPVPVVSSASGA
jgi:hypothetical protein